MIAAALCALLSLAAQGDTIVVSRPPGVGALRVNSPLFRNLVGGPSKNDDPMIIVFPPSVTAWLCCKDQDA